MLRRSRRRDKIGGHAPLEVRARLARPLILLVALAVIGYFLSRFDLIDGRTAVRGAAHRYGIQGYILAALILACLFVPTPLLAATSGIVFGVALGTPVALGILVAAACLQVAVGRVGLRYRLQAGGSRWDERFHQLLRDSGWRAIAAIRLVPLVPFALSNYAFGGTPVSLISVAAGTAIGAAPKTLLYASLGDSVLSLSGQRLLVALMALVGASAMGFYLAHDLWRRSR